MARGRIIFHHPGPVGAQAASGSQVRPSKLLDAFGEAGYEVEAVVGNGAERKAIIRHLLSSPDKLRSLSFVYMESRSIPTVLTENHRLPLYPLMDFRFIDTVKKLGVPVGLFYRDVFWRFEMYKTMLPWYGRWATIPLYQYDWWWYRRVVDHLFLPSIGMAKHLPSEWPESKVSALPPGASLTSLMKYMRSNSQGGLKLLYVGGVSPPAYDLEPLFDLVSRHKRLQLTLCCREKEWAENRSYYAAWGTDRVRVVHQTGDALTKLYQEADLFCLVRKPHEYLDFAVPVKVFEAVGNGVPIIILSGTEAARIVDNGGLGWVASSVAEAGELLERFCDKPGEIMEKKEALLETRLRHSWRARVEDVVNRLERTG